MNVMTTEIPGILILEPKVFTDARGYFFEAWSAAGYEAAGICRKPLMDNIC